MMPGDERPSLRAPPPLHQGRARRRSGRRPRCGGDPHPVVVPADRRDEQAGQRGRQERGHRVPGAVEQVAAAMPRRRRRARRPARAVPGRDGPGEPGDDRAQRLVARPGREPGPVPSRRNTPCSHQGRVRRQDGEADNDGRRGTRRRLPRPHGTAGDEQVRDEDQRHQLDARRDASQRALPPPAPAVAREPGWHRSHMIAAIRIRLTWPRLMVRTTGCSQNVTAAASSVSPPSRTRRSRFPAQGAEREPQRRHQRRHAGDDRRGDPGPSTGETRSARTRSRRTACR